MQKPSVTDSPSGGVPEKASRCDRRRTETCGGRKSILGHSLLVSRFQRIQRGGIRCKSFCFFTESCQLSTKSSQRLYLAQTLIKTQKHNHKSSIIACTLKNRKETRNIKITIGFPPNKRYCFTPLARRNAQFQVLSSLVLRDVEFSISPSLPLSII